MISPSRMPLRLSMAVGYVIVSMFANGGRAHATTPSVLYHIDNNVDLQHLVSPSTYPVIVRDSFATPNDGGQAT
jgi:hypothetical protein